MGILQTAERSSHLDPSENVIYQRHLIAYKEAAKLIRGTVLEVGSGEGYGIMELAPKADHYIAVDKYNTEISDELKKENNITFIQAEVPPLKGIEDNSVDFVVTFQVIEHIEDDEMFLQEIHRVLKPGGHFSISDVVVEGSLPEGLRKDAEMYAGCVSGAIQKEVYLELIHTNRFENICIQKEKAINIPEDILKNYLNDKEINSFKNGSAGIFSLTVFARKPILNNISACTPESGCC